MRLAIVILVFILYTLLFQKAAGTLDVKQLNIISIAYYLTLVFCFIGASLIFCGFREHYLVEKLTQYSIDKTYIILSYTLLIFPLTICFFNKLIGLGNMKKSYRYFIVSDIKKTGSADKVYILILILSVVCLSAMVYVLRNIGYFTLFELFSGSKNLARIRIIITQDFSGNVYIRNIVMLTLTPVLSYISYLYMRITKTRKWKILFGFLFILSLIAKTYNFEKSPVIYYIFYFYILEIFMNRIKDLRYISIISIISFGIILFLYYIVFGYADALLTISSGPVGRIVITQIATLFLHIQAFPDVASYLDGTSLPTFLATLFDLSDSWIRSGKIVMEIYNPSGVAAGTAGVMNSIFVGEAYANWGILGVILSPVYLGTLYSIVNALVIKCAKTPMILIMYLIITISFSQSLLGGFVDFLYSASLLMLLGVIVGIELLCRRGRIVLKRK